jgi:hypothetical protein
MGSMPTVIPIYTLKEGNLTVPISLVYDGSGVKVSEQPSTVGQNWQLQAGGNIVREVRGKPDEMAQIFQNQTFFGELIHKYDETDIEETQNLFVKDTEKDVFLLNIEGKSISFVLDTIVTAGSCNKFKSKAIFLNDIEDYKIDFYIYTATGCGLSVPFEKLILEDDENSLDYRIDRLSGGLIRYFRVTSPSGVQYYFGETVQSREYVYSYDHVSRENFFCQPTSPSISAAPFKWNLTRIIYPKSTTNLTAGPGASNSKFQEVTFSYKRTQSLSKLIKSNVPFTLYYSGTIPVHSKETDIEKRPLYLNSELRKIESVNYLIEFNSDYIFSIANSISQSNLVENFSAFLSTQVKRKDIEALTDYSNLLPTNFYCTSNETNYQNPFKFESGIPKAEIIKNLLIEDKISSKRMGFYFNYSNFKGYTYSENQRENFTDPLKGRLKLIGINQISLGTNPYFLPGYKFIYDDTPLPDYDSFAQDHWGYYNGKDDNETKTGLIEIPRAEILNAFNFAQNTTLISSDLKVDTILAQAGILKEVHFPNGSITKYEYSSHRANNYFESKQSVDGFIKDINYLYIGGLRIKNVKEYDPISDILIETKFTYLNPQNSKSSGFISLWPNSFFKYGHFEAPVANIGRALVYHNLVNLFQSRFFQSPYINYEFIKIENLNTKNSIAKTQGFTLFQFYIDHSEGTKSYKVLNTNTNMFEEDNGLNIGFCFSKYIDPLIKPISNPRTGLLMNIKEFNSIGVKIIEKQFEYSIEQNFLQINQRLLSGPYTVGYEETSGSCTNVPLEEVPVIPFKTQVINFVVSQVQGIVNSAFNSALNATLQSTLNPNYVATSSSSGGFPMFLIMMAVKQAIDVFNGLTGPPMDCGNLNSNLIHYQLPLLKIRKLKDKSTLYDFNGFNPITTHINYYYNPEAKHNSMNKMVKEVTNSSDILLSSVEQIVKYNKDFVIPEGTTDPISLGIKALNDRNMLVPIETYTVKDGKVIGGTINHYYSDASKEGFVKKTYSLELAKPINLAAFNPSSVDPSSGIFTSDANYRVTAKFNSYNERGLVTEIENVKEFKENTNTPGVEFIQSKTTIGYTHNNLIKSSVTTQGLGSDTRTTTYESIPLFGETRRILPNNDVVKTEYDDLGRVKLIRDKDENILKSYFYNDKIPSSSLSFSINNGTETLLTLEDVGSYEKTILAGQTSLALKSDLIGFGAKSVQLKFTNPAGVTTTVNSSNTTQSIFYSDISNQTWNIGGYYVEVLAYRGENTQGDIVGRRKIFFNIIDSTINQQRTIKPKN